MDLVVPDKLFSLKLTHLPPLHFSFQTNFLLRSIGNFVLQTTIFQESLLTSTKDCFNKCYKI